MGASAPFFYGRINMLIVKTYIDKSPIHGIGLFAAEDILKDTIVWTFNPQIDSIIRKDEMSDVPEHVRAFLTKYAWVDNDGHWRIGVDNDKYINHADNPNTSFLPAPYVFIALRDIRNDEEITQDYAEYSNSVYAQSLKRDC